MDFHESPDTGYTDGSRIEGVTGVAPAEGGMYLGELAMVTNAELLGIAMAWEEGYNTVASDSQVAIQRCTNLSSGAQKGRSWVDE